ncbi:hypothetical protein S7711_05068 [Stachybotrys chartarum IBT 7711]|uniref:Pectate lyase domain-containing protein n=1 Tax=Stachybotrys chartarum (strain CBS 109288 / IBT 7711) TaxID=1280523 RepID=A0A084BAR0_STACB|nr:hypothetical protein S7711_05068 [Stachybotrys chartarum IBT 7711]KFA46000.1 hypothetical protein S40293_08785 [Stachybotrys chartarum IBT 40293]
MYAYSLLALLPMALACSDAPAPSAVVPTTLVSSVVAAATSSSAPAASSPAPAPAPAPGTGSSSSDGPIGYGAGTTGGGSGEGVTVTSCAELETALETGGVIRISGILSDCGVLVVPSDTSIIGVGGASGLNKGGFRVKKSENIIFQNLELSQSPEGKDLIDIETSSYIWVDHCDFSNDGLTGDKDFYDGMFDAKRGADFITVSYTKFHDHFKASLIGHSDSNASQDEGTLHVTYHHNLWSNINSRAPSIRFGTAHIFSSCYEDIPTSGINSRMGAQVFVEENSFTNVKRAIVTNLDSDQDGFAIEKNNLYDNSDVEITQEGSFTPPYEYTVTPAAEACAVVKAQAGVGII